MRESIGGGWLLTIVAIFIVLFTSFLAVSINYTKAFKIKNYIINRIEFDEGYIQYNSGDLENLETTDGSTEADIYVYLKNAGYNGNNITAKNCINSEFGTDENSYKDGGYCVQEITDNNGQRYYKVTTFIVFDLPFIDNSFTIPINGETKTIYYG